MRDRRCFFLPRWPKIHSTGNTVDEEASITLIRPTKYNADEYSHEKEVSRLPYFFYNSWSFWTFNRLGNSIEDKCCATWYCTENLSPLLEHFQRSGDKNSRGSCISVKFWILLAVGTTFIIEIPFVESNLITGHVWRNISFELVISKLFKVVEAVLFIIRHVFPARPFSATSQILRKLLSRVFSKVRKFQLRRIPRERAMNQKSRDKVNTV